MRVVTTLGSVNEFTTTQIVTLHKVLKTLILVAREFPTVRIVVALRNCSADFFRVGLSGIAISRGYCWLPFAFFAFRSLRGGLRISRA